MRESLRAAVGRAGGGLHDYLIPHAVITILPHWWCIAWHRSLRAAARVYQNTLDHSNPVLVYHHFRVEACVLYGLLPRRHIRMRASTVSIGDDANARALATCKRQIRKIESEFQWKVVRRDQIHAMPA